MQLDANDSARMLFEEVAALRTQRKRANDDKTNDPKFFIIRKANKHNTSLTRVINELYTSTYSAASGTM